MEYPLARAGITRDHGVWRVTFTVDHLRSIEEALKQLPEEAVLDLANKEGIKEALSGGWTVNPGPQTAALHCEADELLYGGAAGGGKSDLLLGLALTQHKRSLILRRTDKEASRFIRRMDEILDNDRTGWNGQQKTFTWPDRGQIIEFGGCQLEDDKQKFKGEAKDLIGFDEVSDFTETQFRFIKGWNRTSIPGQRCRVVCASNPPTIAEGMWVVAYWAPWLDPNHPNPARPGELRWFLTIDNRDTEVDGPGPYQVGHRMVVARSRTFIPSFVKDNPDYADTDYESVLAGFKDELREAYLEGNFAGSFSDDPMQAIPTDWIQAAQDRWREDGWKNNEMSAMALDCSGGGKDPAILMYRFGGWFAKPRVLMTKDTTKDTVSQDMANMVFHERKHGAPVVVDAGGGFASGVIMRFNDNRMSDYLRFDGSQTSNATARGLGLRFYNRRAEAVWRMREELDPDQEGGSVLALPPDAELKADLAAYTYDVTMRGIKIEEKKEIKKRLGRSTDKGDTAIMCLNEGNKAIVRRMGGRTEGRMPKVNLGYSRAKSMSMRHSRG